MRIFLRSILFAVALVFISGCEPASSRHLVLPEGNVARGQELFVNMQCTACHTVRDLNLPAPEGEREYSHMLGGRSAKSHAEIVTSVINPSHRLARPYRVTMEEDSDTSPMLNYNDIMTVSELVDVVAFLEDQYKVERPESRYRYVPYAYSE